MARNKEFRLPQVISIRHAAELKKDLLNLLDSGKSPWRVDWSECQKCDLAVLQVMAAFVLEAKTRGGEVHFYGPLDPNLSQSLEQSNFLTFKNNEAVFFEQLSVGGVICESR